MASWSNRKCSITRDADGGYTVKCSATVTNSTGAYRVFITRSASHGYSSAVASGSGAKSWTAGTGTSFGEIRYSGTFYLRQQAKQGGSYTTESSAVFSATLAAAEFTVSFDPGPGTVAPGSKTVSYGEPYGELPTPSRSGYAFTGWYTRAEGGTRITAADTVAITEDATLYAHWEAQSILHLVSGGSVSTVTRIRTVDGGAVKNVIAVFSVENGVVKRGV